MPDILNLACGDTRLDIAPNLGGGIAAFTWCGRNIFRPGILGNDPLLLSSFVLTPFANRIAKGVLGETGLHLRPNRPVVDPLHAIHGYGWTAVWQVKERNETSAVLVHSSMGGDWPWDYQAEQIFSVSQDGFEQRLSITNRSRIPMPSGLGLHPYLPRANANLALEAEGIWHSDDGNLPSHFERTPKNRDWLDGEPLDNALVGRRGPIVITWPTHRLVVEPQADLSFTHIYSPRDEDYFCIEPVSHMPNAINRPEPESETGLKWLEPDETWQTSVRFLVEDAR